MSRIFGWDYPPGCSSVPGDEIEQCQVCGGMDLNPKQARGRFVCECPECPECSKFGDPGCYKPVSEGGHGLVLSDAQKAQAEAVLEHQRQIDEDLAKAYSDRDDKEDFLEDK